MNYLIVIPYITSESQGREIEYAVAGWQRHFKEEHTIAIVGDMDAHITRVLSWSKEGSRVAHIQMDRVPECGYENYRAHLDFVPKMKAARKAFPYTVGFIYSCDDIYAVNDFDFWNDVFPLKYIPGGVDFDPHSPNPFRRDKMKTKRVLESLGFPCRNFTTHLPQWLEWDKLEALWEKYYMAHNSLVFEDLYFNLYYPVAGAIAIDGDDRFKCEVRNSQPDINRLLGAFKSRIWINNNPTGFVPALDSLLDAHYKL